MRFNYQARTKSGEIRSGTVEAGSKESAIETLQRHNLIVVFLEETSSVPFYARSLKIFQKIKLKDLTFFYRQLAILFEADISPLESLRILGEQIKNPIFKEIIFNIENDVRGGEPLSVTMGKHPKVFSQFYGNVVKAGEATGNLNEVLKYLADHAEREYNITSKVKGAFTYPIAIFCLFLVVAILMMIFVVPQLAAALQEMGQALPFATRLLIGTSTFLRSWFWLVAIVAIGIIVGLKKIIKTPSGKIFVDKLKLKVPIFKELFKKIYLARFAENLKTLAKGGIPILKALDITAAVIGNKIYETIIQKAKEKVRVGETISSAFDGYPREVTPAVTQMLAVGEKTAQLDTILDKIAIFYQQDIDRMVGNMTQLIEPLMLLILGGAVAFLVASILLPIYNMSSAM
jgi:type IV pilus assembly protein PilC